MEPYQIQTPPFAKPLEQNCSLYQAAVQLEPEYHYNYIFYVHKHDNNMQLFGSELVSFGCGG